MVRCLRMVHLTLQVWLGLRVRPTPRHMLEQAQNEMRSHFDIPFLRFDLVGIQHVKQDYFVSDLRKYHWNAVLADRASRIVAQPVEKTHGWSPLFLE